MAYNNAADDYGYRCDDDFDYRQYDSDDCPDDREDYRDDYNCYDPENGDDCDYDYNEEDDLEGEDRFADDYYESGKCHKNYDSDVEATSKYCVMTDEIHTVINRMIINQTMSKNKVRPEKSLTKIF